MRQRDGTHAAPHVYEHERLGQKRDELEETHRDHPRRLVQVLPRVPTHDHPAEEHGDDAAQVGRLRDGVREVREHQHQRAVYDPALVPIAGD